MIFWWNIAFCGCFNLSHSLNVLFDIILDKKQWFVSDQHNTWWNEVKLIMWEDEEYLKCTIKLKYFDYFWYNIPGTLSILYIYILNDSDWEHLTVPPAMPTRNAQWRGAICRNLGKCQKMNARCAILRSYVEFFHFFKILILILYIFHSWER